MSLVWKYACFVSLETAYRRQFDHHIIKQCNEILSPLFMHEDQEGERSAAIVEVTKADALD